MSSSAERDKRLPEHRRKVASSFDDAVETYTYQIDEAVGFSGLKTEFFVEVKCVYLERLVKEFLGSPEEMAVLDLGCGVGAYHRLLSPKFRNLTGLDISPRSIDYAKRTNPDVTYRVYDGGRLPFDDGAFDVAFASCVLHHVPVGDWAGFASEMARVLRPGGMAVVFEHNPYNPVTRRIVSTCPLDEGAVLLRPKRVRDLMAASGLTTLRSRAILSVPPVYNFLYPVDELLGLLGLGAQYLVAARK